ncbi:MAG TPA: glycosyltransferase family 2 protein [Xanthomonadaceae bacterium]|nr:glycosyltransferase family 2 protein [Xanthomonadaceae bacterium]
MPDLVPHMPLISVALCTYNGALYLREQLDSVLAQSEVTIEIVVIDDGSSDGTAAILEEYAARDARIRWQRNERNLGPTASFERAMSLCGGEFIAPCDQDDIWHPQKLARLLAAIGPCDVAYANSDFVDAQGIALNRRISDDLTMIAGNNPIAFLFAHSVSGHAMLLRRKLFEAVRPFPADVYFDMWLALCAAGRNGVRYLDESLVRFRRHASAHSPMGKSARTPRDAASSRAWLDHRQSLMRGYALTGLRECDVAGALANAMQRARDLGRTGALMRLVWRHRQDLPQWKGIPSIDALKWQLRISKNLRRARRKTDADMTDG